MCLIFNGKRPDESKKDHDMAEINSDILRSMNFQREGIQQPVSFHPCVQRSYEVQIRTDSG
jgi:hypothetical protein